MSVACQQNRQPTQRSAAGGGLSLIIPAWNEEAVLSQAITEATTALEAVVAGSGRLTNFEVVIVDDGSTDQTAKIAREAAERCANVRWIQQPGNCGYGAALRAGFEAAHYEFVAFTDADCQFDLTNLGYMLPLADQYDMVYGYRIDRKDPPLRRFMSWGYNQVIRVLLGSPVRDIDCALKIFRRDQLPSILPEARGFFANTEMLSRACKLNRSVVEVGVAHRPRASGESKVSMSDVPKTLRSLLPYWWCQVQHSSARTPSPAALSGFWPALLLVAMLAAGMLFPRIGYPFIEPDEARYGEIAREMLTSGEWVVPKFNGEPYYDKPPLFYWMTALSFRTFGISEAAARLVPTGAMFFTILGTFFFGRRLFGTLPAGLAAAGLSVSVGTVHLGRFLILDPLLTLFVTWSLFLMLEAMRGTRLHWGWFLGSSLCCGLGVMTKGPVAVALLLPPVVAYAWLSRLPAAPSWKQWLAYLCLAGGLSVPWFTAVVASDPAFAKYFFWDHNVARFLSGANHPKPFWFYLPVMAAACMPWTLLALPFAVSLFRRSESARALRPLPLGFLLLSAGWCVLFFSTSKGKLPPYILPALPFVALLLGHYAEHAIWRAIPSMSSARQSMGRYGAAAICWAGLGIGIAACLLGLEQPVEGMIELGLWATCLAGLALVWKTLPAKPAWALCCVFAAAALMQTSQDLFPAWAAKRSVMSHVPLQINKQLLDAQMPIAVIGDEFGSVPFALNRNDVANFKGARMELLDDFIDAHGRALLLMKSNFAMKELRRMLPPNSILTEQGRVGTPNYGSAAEAKIFLVETRPRPAMAMSRSGRRRAGELPLSVLPHTLNSLHTLNTLEQTAAAPRDMVY